MMRGITLWQPYASLVALGLKTFETRSWGSSYRGPLLIHAARRWDADVADDCRRATEAVAGLHIPPGSARYALGSLAWRETLGRVLACVRLRGVARVPREGWRPDIHAPAFDFDWGDLSPGRYAWDLVEVQPIMPPVPWRGEQGLWAVPPDLAEACRLTSDVQLPLSGTEG
jgi:activating signal cointegrator 1